MNTESTAKKKAGKEQPAESPVRGKLLGVKQTVEKTGLSRSWICNKIVSGNLPFPYFLTAGGKRQFDSADIDDWLRSCKVPAGGMPWERG